MFAVTGASLLSVGRLCEHVSACERDSDCDCLSSVTEVGLGGALPGTIFLNSVVKMSEAHLTSLKKETQLEGVPIATPLILRNCR